jgi:hypothetical protein
MGRKLRRLKLLAHLRKPPALYLEPDVDETFELEDIFDAGEDIESWCKMKGRLLF